MLRDISDAALPWLLGTSVLAAGIVGGALALLTDRIMQRRRWAAVRLGRRRLPPVHETTGHSPCGGCDAWPGQRHGRHCREIPAGWFTEVVTRRA